jgi:hypothetical protein
MLLKCGLARYDKDMSTFRASDFIRFGSQQLQQPHGSYE